MPYQYLLYETQDAIVTLTLNCPDRLNALGETLRAELAFETFAQHVCRETEDAREGIRAFVDKRPPRSQGR